MQPVNCTRRSLTIRKFASRSTHRSNNTSSRSEPEKSAPTSLQSTKRTLRNETNRPPLRSHCTNVVRNALMRGMCRPTKATPSNVEFSMSSVSQPSSDNTDAGTEVCAISHRLSPGSSNSAVQALPGAASESRGGDAYDSTGSTHPIVSRRPVSMTQERLPRAKGPILGMAPVCRKLTAWAI